MMTPSKSCPHQSNRSSRLDWILFLTEIRELGQIGESRKYDTFFEPKTSPAETRERLEVYKWWKAIWSAPISRKSHLASCLCSFDTESQIEFLRPRKKFSKIIAAAIRPLPTLAPSPTRNTVRDPSGSLWVCL
jgi:hypothetical protein